MFYSFNVTRWLIDCTRKMRRIMMIITMLGQALLCISNRWALDDAWSTPTHWSCYLLSANTSNAHIRAAYRQWYVRKSSNPWFRFGFWSMSRVNWINVCRSKRAKHSDFVHQTSDMSTAQVYIYIFHSEMTHLDTKIPFIPNSNTKTDHKLSSRFLNANV